MKVKYVIFILLISVILFSDDIYYSNRKMMVEELRSLSGIRDKNVLSSMLKVPRHKFVPYSLSGNAYINRPLPIGYGQTISSPEIVGLMTQLLKLKKTDTLLEVGTGSGYQAAVAALLCKTVYSIEIVKPLSVKARSILKNLALKNVKLKVGDGYFGWKEYSPFNKIIVTCAVNHIPPPLIKQLKRGGRMVIPVGHQYSIQTLFLLTKLNNGIIKTKKLMEVMFVPMTGHAMRRN